MGARARLDIFVEDKKPHKLHYSISPLNEVRLEMFSDKEKLSFHPHL
jgi:hypothetical protein